MLFCVLLIAWFCHCRVVVSVNLHTLLRQYLLLENIIHYCYAV